MDTLGYTWVKRVVINSTITSGMVTVGFIIRTWKQPMYEYFWSTLPFPYPITYSEEVIFGYLSVIGAMFGSLVAGLVYKLIGPCRAVVLYESLIIIGWILYLVPVIGGILCAVLQITSICAIRSIIPTYVAEISHANNRGTLIMISQVFLNTAFLFFHDGIMNRESCIIFSVWIYFHVIGMLFVPEFKRKKYGNLLNENSTNMTELSQDIILEVIDSPERSKYEQQRISKRADCKAILVGIGCMFFQQMSGINFVFLKLYVHINESPLKTEFIWTFVKVIQFIMTVLTATVIDKTGRQFLLIFSAFMMCIGFFGLTYCTFQTKIEEFDRTVFGLLVLCSSAFSLGFGPVPWVLMGEIFSTKMRPYGPGFVTASHILFNAIVTIFSNSLMDTPGFYYLSCGILCLISIGFVIVYVPETKNESLDHIQRKLAA